MDFFFNIKKYWNYAVYSAGCTLRAEVANSYLNWVWWILEPLGMMCVYATVFGVFFHSKEQYYPVFIFIGLTMWNFFNGTLLGSINLIRKSRAIVANIYIPKYILLLVQLLVLGFKMLLSFGITVLMMVFYRVPLNWNMLYFFPILLIFILFCYGCGAVFMNLGVYISDLFDATKILLRMLMYLSGIFYSLEKRVPEPYGRWLQKYNPVAYFIHSIREAILYGNMPNLRWMTLWTIGTFLMIGIGIQIVRKNENDYVKVI